MNLPATFRAFALFAGMNIEQFVDDMIDKYSQKKQKTNGRGKYLRRMRYTLSILAGKRHSKSRRG